MVNFTLTLVRHGQTKANKERVIQGQLDFPLSDVGLKQANYIAERLKNEQYAYVFSSDLTRAYDTARAIIEKNLNTKELQLDKRLRERSFGEAEGKTVTEMKKFAKIRSEKKFTPAGGETVDEVKIRAISFFKELSQRFLELSNNQQLEKVELISDASSNNLSESDQFEKFSLPSSANSPIIGNKFQEDSVPSALIVSHGGFIKELIRYFVEDLKCDVSQGKDEALRISPNTGLSMFRVSINCNEKPKLKCLLIHDQNHLLKNGENGENMIQANEESL